MQKDRRRHLKAGLTFHSIGFAVYDVSNDSQQQQQLIMQQQQLLLQQQQQRKSRNKLRHILGDLPAEGGDNNNINNFNNGDKNNNNMDYSNNSNKYGVLDQQWFVDNPHRAMSMFCKSREVSLRLRLKPGEYMIVPSTFHPNDEANFLLRIFTAKKPGEHHLRWGLNGIG